MDNMELYLSEEDRLKLEELNSAIEEVNKNNYLSLEKFTAEDVVNIRAMNEYIDLPFLDQKSFYELIDDIKNEKYDVNDDLVKKMSILAKNRLRFNDVLKDYTIYDPMMENMYNIDLPEDLNNIAVLPINEKNKDIYYFNALASKFENSRKYDIEDVKKYTFDVLKNKEDLGLSDYSDEEIIELINRDFNEENKTIKNHKIFDIGQEVFENLRKDNKRILPIYNSKSGDIYFIKEDELENSGISYKDIRVNNNAIEEDGKIMVDGLPFNKVGIDQDQIKDIKDNIGKDLEEELNSDIEDENIDLENRSDNNIKKDEDKLDDIKAKTKEEPLIAQFESSLNLYNKIVEDYDRTYKMYADELKKLRQEFKDKFDRSMQKKTINDISNMVKNPLNVMFPFVLYGELAFALKDLFVMSYEHFVERKMKLRPLFEDVSEKREEMYKTREHLSELNNKLEKEIEDYKDFISRGVEYQEANIEKMSKNEIYRSMMDNDGKEVKKYRDMLTGSYTVGSGGKYIQYMKSLSQLDKHVKNIHLRSGMAEGSIFAIAFKQSMGVEFVEHSPDVDFKNELFIKGGKKSLTTKAIFENLDNEKVDAMIDDLRVSYLGENSDKKYNTIILDHLRNSKNVDEFFRSVSKDEKIQEEIKDINRIGLNRNLSYGDIKKQSADIMTKHIKIHEALISMKAPVKVRQAYEIADIMNKNLYDEIYQKSNDVKGFLINGKEQLLNIQKKLHNREREKVKDVDKSVIDMFDNSDNDKEISR